MSDNSIVFHMTVIRYLVDIFRKLSNSEIFKWNNCIDLNTDCVQQLFATPYSTRLPNFEEIIC